MMRRDGAGTVGASVPWDAETHSNNGEAEDLCEACGGRARLVRIRCWVTEHAAGMQIFADVPRWPWRWSHCPVG